MIDRDAARPLYLQIADVLRRRIANGELPPDRPLPGEHALCTEFGVARGTIRSAVNVLREAGLVVRVSGRGTFVSPTLGQNPPNS